MTDLNITALTAHISDSDIEEGIDGEIADDIDQVREALATFQKSAVETWSEHMDSIRNGVCWLVAETDDVIVLAVRRPRYHEYLEPTGHDTRDMVSAVNSVMHILANRLTGYDWQIDSPLVIAKPDDFTSGRQFTHSVINGYINQGLSPGQAWAYYGVKILGNSRNSWSKRCGYSDHSAVSEPLRKAESKLSRSTQQS